MVEAGARVFIVKISWGDCGEPEQFKEYVDYLNKKADVVVAEKGIVVRTSQLDDVMDYSRRILRVLEEGGCQPNFSLSVEIPREPTVISSPKKPQEKSRGHSSARRNRRSQGPGTKT